MADADGVGCRGARGRRGPEPARCAALRARARAGGRSDAVARRARSSAAGGSTCARRSRAAAPTPAHPADRADRARGLGRARAGDAALVRAGSNGNGIGITGYVVDGPDGHHDRRAGGPRSSRSPDSPTTERARSTVRARNTVGRQHRASRRSAGSLSGGFVVAPDRPARPGRGVEHRPDAVGDHRRPSCPRSDGQARGRRAAAGRHRRLRARRVRRSAPVRDRREPAPARRRPVGGVSTAQRLGPRASR